jgi:hypothetical protein
VTVRILACLWLCIASGPLWAVPLPGGFDHSGWYQFEIVVMVDTRAEVLESETWPLVPRVNYPAQWRWLREPDRLALLKQTHLYASVAGSASGHILVREAAPLPPSWEPPASMLTEGDLVLINELIELGKGTDSRARAREQEDPTDSVPTQTPSAGPLLPFEAITPAVTSPSLISLDPLDITGVESEDESVVNVPFAKSPQIVELKEVAVSAARIPTPETFVQLSLDRLAPGLARYRRTSEDDIIASVSWLQGPDSRNLPIVIEPENEQGFPLAQGFIQLRPSGDQWRLGLNFWVNTAGHYLPDVFEMPPPPPSPQRIAVLHRAAPQVGSFASASAPNLALPAPEAAAAQQSPAVSFDGGAMPVSIAEVTAPAQPPDWPWRHLIHVADTVPLAANRLRYYDHPVIKVLAIWRELTWYELFDEGAKILATQSASQQDGAAASAIDPPHLASQPQ